MKKLWLSCATGLLLLVVLSVRAEAGFALSTGYNNRSDWGSVTELAPYFNTSGYLSGSHQGQSQINPIIANCDGRA